MLGVGSYRKTMPIVAAISTQNTRCRPSPRDTPTPREYHFVDVASPTASIAIRYTVEDDRTVIQWQYYPKSDASPPIASAVISAFQSAADVIDSAHNTLDSNDVLAAITPQLQAAGFQVESGKKAADKIQVPVLFGRNGKLEKWFDADAYHDDAGFVLEVEAGRGVINNQFLKDLFQACMMHGVSHLGIAVRNDYRGAADFEKVVQFFDTMYASNRLRLPLDGILVVGY